MACTKFGIAIVAKDITVLYVLSLCDQGLCLPTGLLTYALSSATAYRPVGSLLQSKLSGACWPSQSLKNHASRSFCKSGRDKVTDILHSDRVQDSLMTAQSNASNFSVCTPSDSVTSQHSTPRLADYSPGQNLSAGPSVLDGIKFMLFQSCSWDQDVSSPGLSPCS